MKYFPPTYTLIHKETPFREISQQNSIDLRISSFRVFSYNCSEWNCDHWPWARPCVTRDSWPNRLVFNTSPRRRRERRLETPRILNIRVRWRGAVF